ncbi:MAG: four helix bundle protein [bacterium]|nr:four helix bundle protein [bacterium]MDP3771315.1 four helix bundle protein [bacterium]
MSDVIPLLGALTRLWDDTYDRIRQFPKLDKHLFGQRILDDLDACTYTILLALNDPQGRAGHLIRASAHFDRVKLRFRVAVRRALFSDRWYADHLETIAGIGKMLGGWRRSSPPPTREHDTTPPWGGEVRSP